MATSFSFGYGPEELAKQVNEYHTLSFFKSARGGVVLAILIAILLTFLLFVFAMVNLSSLIFGVVLYLPLAIMSYKGVGWANIALMIIWSLDKLTQLVIAPSYFIGIIAWWVGFLMLFYRSYQVEKARKVSLTGMQQPVQVSSSQTVAANVVLPQASEQADSEKQASQ